MFFNLSDNSFNISDDFFICKPDYFKALFLQPSSPFLITNLLAGQLMIAAIELYNKFFLQTYEICNIIANNILSSERMPQRRAFKVIP